MKELDHGRQNVDLEARLLAGTFQKLAGIPHVSPSLDGPHLVSRRLLEEIFFLRRVYLTNCTEYPQGVCRRRLCSVKLSVRFLCVGNKLTIGRVKKSIRPTTCEHTRDRPLVRASYDVVPIKSSKEPSLRNALSNRAAREPSVSSIAWR